MEILLLIALGVGVYQLWRRIEALELKIRQIESRPVWTAPEPAAATEPARPPQPASAREEAAVAKAARDFVPAEPLGSAEASEPVAVDHATQPQPRERFALPRFDFEDLFGRLLPIWAGGITLAVAGFFIVLYSIEAGLLTPSVRVVLGFLFGFGLLGGAEAAYRFEQRVADPRVRQALAGAGLATLYASFYLAGSHYGLIGPVGAFLGLAAVTAAAIFLAGRFGLPCAVLGLVGGFAAPLLVGGDEANLPLLSAYLGLVTAGLMVTSRQRRWAWLGLTALGGGLAWGALLLVGFDGGPADTLALGGLLVALGAVLPAMAMPDFGPGRRLAESLAAGMAALQMTVLVGAAGYSMLSWGLLGLLAVGLAVLGWNKPELRRASAFAALILPMLLVGWDQAGGIEFAVVAAALALILAGVPAALVRLGRHSHTDVLQIAVATIGLFGAAWGRFSSMLDRPEWLLGLAGAALAAFPLLAAQPLLVKRGERAEWGAVLLAATGYVLLLFAGQLVTPVWSAPFVAAVLGGLLLALAWGRDDPRLANLAWAAALVAALLLLPASRVAEEFERMAGLPGSGADLLGTLRWATPLALFAGLAWIDHRPIARQVAGGVAGAFAYAALAQLLPVDLLAWTAAALAVAAMLVLPALWAAPATLAAIAACWAALPLTQWLGAGAAALAGDALLVTDLPDLRAVALRLLPLSAIAAAACWTYRERLAHSAPRAAALCGLAVVVPAHVAFKHLFAISDGAEFVRLGLAERTVWQGLLLALAYGLTRLAGRHAGARAAALVIGAAALLHWAWFSLLLHNPLHAAQAVGPWPVLNLLLASYGLAIAALIAARSRFDGNRLTAIDAAIMILLGLLAISQLRQAFTGTYLAAAPISATEDLLRSLLGIVLAILFLAWGARRHLRSWRIGSLVLMVLAVLKVFLVDAADLEDLARIASFVALGFSLIGIGWFYARQLRGAATTPAESP